MQPELCTPAGGERGSHPNVADYELLLAWQGGDRDAGGALIARHFWSVFNFFRTKVGPAAEDLTQRTFLGSVEARDRTRADLSFRAYLFGIARNQLLLYFRRARRDQGAVVLSEVSVAQLVGTPSQVAAAREEQRVLLAALQQIPADFQIAVELYYWEELSVAEVAQVLGVAPGTVKSRLGRARRLLRERIAKMKLPAHVLAWTTEQIGRWGS